MYNELFASIISLENEIEDLTTISKGKGHAAKAAKNLLPLRRKALKELHLQTPQAKKATQYKHKEVATMFNDKPSRFEKDIADNLDEWSGLS